MPKLHRYRKKTAPSELSQVTDAKERRRIINTVEASQRFVLFSCIAMGLAQMMALQPNIAKATRKRRYLRTSSEIMRDVHPDHNFPEEIAGQL